MGNVDKFTKSSLLLVTVATLGFKTRNVFSAFRESSWILHSSTYITLSSVIGLVILNATNGTNVTKFYIRAALIAFAAFVTYGKTKNLSKDF